MFGKSLTTLTRIGRSSDESVVVCQSLLCTQPG
jgi:hypothetical protein